MLDASAFSGSTFTRKVYLKKGMHVIEIPYVAWGELEELDITWSGPGFSRRKISPSELSCLGSNDTKIKVETSLRQSSQADSTSLSDGFYSTFLRFEEASYGDTINLHLSSARTMADLIIFSGDQSFQQLTDAQLEISSDGKAYKSAGRIIEGRVYLDDVFKQVKHLRIKLLRDYPAGLMLREIQILNK